MPALSSAPIVTLSEARSFVPAGVDDATLQLFIDSATPVVEGIVGPVVPRVVSLTATTYGTVILPGRVVSVTVTRNALPVTDYVLNAEAGLLSGVAPDDVIAATVGFDPIPAAIRLAALYAVQHAVESDAGAVVNGQGAGDEVFTLSRGFFLPNRAKELLDPYRLPGGLA